MAFEIILNVLDLTDLNMTCFMLLLSKSLLFLSLVLVFHLFFVCCQTSRVELLLSEFIKELVENRTLVLTGILALFFNCCLHMKLQTDSFYEEYVTICLSLFTAGVLWFWPYDDVDFALSQNFKTSIGACWANGAVMAYYEESLNKFKARAQKFEDDHPDVTLLVKKLVLIAPLSCNIEGSLSDENIHHLGDLETIEHDEGANINRKYITPVYEVKYQNMREFIAAEYPSPLGTLWGERYGMDEDAEIYIRDCFLKELREQLKNKPVIILEYDDRNELETVPLNQFLISSLQKHHEEYNIVDNMLHEK